MENKLIIEVPQESEEFLKQRNDFKWTLDLEVFSKFWGLYILKLPIPADVWNYVLNHKCPIEDVSIQQAFKFIQGAPFEQDSIVRQMVLKEIV